MWRGFFSYVVPAILGVIGFVSGFAVASWFSWWLVIPIVLGVTVIGNVFVSLVVRTFPPPSYISPDKFLLLFWLPFLCFFLIGVSASLVLKLF
jgi:putative copper export protein